MTQSAIIMKDQLAAIVSQRSRVWENYDIAINNEGELTTLSRKLIDPGPADIITNLTRNALPPDELQRAVKIIKDEFENIARAEQQIVTSQADIERIRSNIRTGYTWIIVLVITAVAVLVIWLAQARNSNPTRSLSFEPTSAVDYYFDEHYSGYSIIFNVFGEASG